VLKASQILIYQKKKYQAWVLIYSNKDCRKENFKAGTEVSYPENVQAWVFVPKCSKSGYHRKF
jgi:hypothetical protein